MDRRLEAAFVAGVPLALAVLELFHPHPHDLFHLDLKAWMAVHYLQILFFPLVGLALALVVRGRRGFAAGVCRVGAFVFGVSWVAFDTAAGVTTGILLQAAQASGSPDAWRAPVMAVWAHPIVGSGAVPDAPPPLLAVAGSLAWLVGCAAAAVALRRGGSSWIPVVLLVIAGASFFVFRTHAWPGGPIAFGALGLAAAWLYWKAPT